MDLCLGTQKSRMSLYGKMARPAPESSLVTREPVQLEAAGAGFGANQGGAERKSSAKC